MQGGTFTLHTNTHTQVAANALLSTGLTYVSLSQMACGLELDFYPNSNQFTPLLHNLRHYYKCARREEETLGRPAACFFFVQIAAVPHSKQSDFPLAHL